MKNTSFKPAQHLDRHDFVVKVAVGKVYILKAQVIMT